MYLGKIAKKWLLVYSFSEKSFHIFFLVLQEQFHVYREDSIQFNSIELPVLTNIQQNLCDGAPLTVEPNWYI